MLHVSPDELPRGKDLPDTDGIPMENDVHVAQSRTYLIDPLRLWFRERAEAAWVSGNSFVYYQPRQQPLGPDVYVVPGADDKDRSHFVVWEEEWRLPKLAIELLSPSTEARDRGDKFEIYRDVWKMPDYFLFDTQTRVLEGFHLHKRAYVVIRPDERGLFPCQSLPLFLGVKNGLLRWHTPDGQVVLTEAEKQTERADRESERANQESERANQEAERANQEAELRRAETERANQEAELRRAETERANQEAEFRERETGRADRLAAQLRALGIDPNND